MMKAEVAAENRPAYLPDQHMCTYTVRRTYNNETYIQVRVALPQIIPIILFGLLVIDFVESRTMILGS